MKDKKIIIKDDKVDPENTNPDVTETDVNGKGVDENSAPEPDIKAEENIEDSGKDGENNETLEQILTSESELKKFAQKKGLLALTVKELRLLAEFMVINLKNKKTKKDIASSIANKGENSKIFVMGEPVGYAQIKLNLAGFKAGFAYPVDKERLDFFLKSKVIVR